MSKCTAIIEHVSTIAAHTTEVVFRLAAPFEFEAGQYVTVIIPSLVQYSIREQIRDFSIASAPEELPLLTIAYRDSESKFKQALLKHDANMTVNIDGPKGIFTLPSDTAVPIVCIAGGVGITPFLSMIRHIVRAKLSYRLTLMYCNRSRETAPYLAELEGYGTLIDLVSVFGDLTKSQVQSYVQTHPGRNQWYLAGPRGMVTAARTVLSELAVDERVIMSEEFAGYE